MFWTLANAALGCEALDNFWRMAMKGSSPESALAVASKYKKGSGVMVLRSSGSKSKAAILGVNEEGLLVVGWTENGKSYSKAIPPEKCAGMLSPVEEGAQAALGSTVEVPGKRIFAGAPSHEGFGKGNGFSASRRLENGETVKVFYDGYGDFKYAQKNGKIFSAAEIPGFRPTDLAPGKYTYVVLDDGSMVFGKVENSFEFGVKHGHLAQGENVVAAGELSIESGGSYKFNLESGSYTQKLVSSGKTSMGELEKKMTRLFEAEMGGKAGQYTDKVLLDGRPPSASELKVLCNSVLFKVNNKAICDMVFGQ